MKPKEAIKLIEQLQNMAIQKGLFTHVSQVNNVSMAIATLQAALLEKQTAETE